MFAVIKFGGKQFKVEQGQELDLDLIQKVEGEAFEINDILLIGGEKTEISPKKASIKCEVIQHFRAEKLVVFKKRRRQTFKRKTGHRQDYTRVKIKEIVNS